MLVQLRWTAGLCLAVGCRGSQTEVATDHGSSSSGGHHEGSTASEPTGASTADSSTTSAESISTSATDTSGASETSTQSSESSSAVTSSDGSENDVSSTTGLATDGEATAASSSETTEGGTQGVETSGNATSSTTESTTSTGGAGSCGNGLPDEGELCDDGNLVGGDGCEDDCTSSDNVQPIWTFELGGADGYVDCGTGVAFDAEGNLILGAYTEPDVIWIRKLDVDYVEQWTVTYPGQPGGQCPRTKVAVDEDGNIGFTGGISTGGIDSNDGTFFGMQDAAEGEGTIPGGQQGLELELVGDPGLVAKIDPRFGSEPRRVGIRCLQQSVGDKARRAATREQKGCQQPPRRALTDVPHGRRAYGATWENETGNCRVDAGGGVG